MRQTWRPKSASWVLPALVVISSLLPASAAEEFVLAKKGQPAAALVLLPNSGPLAEQTATDLARVLGKMTGATFDLAADPLKTPALVVGLASEWTRLAKEEAPEKRLATAAPESFLLQSSPSRLLVLGKDAEGVLHGVYTLLRDLGCRWYFLGKDWEVIPQLKDVAMKADRVEGPAMKVRILSNGAGAGASARLFEIWARRNRLGSAYGKQAVHHSYAGYVPKALFKEHPEYFAWVSKDGETKGTVQNGEQPCTTHPEVVKRFKEGALAGLTRQKEATGQAPRLISISPNDGTPNMCRCERCLATGSYGDCALLLANQVAETIHAAFPETLVGFLAYGRAGALPIRVTQGHPNVLASIATGYNWKNSVPRLIEAWPKVVRHATIYEYYAIGASGARAPDNTEPNVASIAQTLRAWHARGIEGVNGEMENDWGSCGHRFWSFAEFAWNPALRPEAVMDDFYAKCWGEAAAPMRRYYERWESGQRANPRVLRLAFQDLDEAARLAKSPEILRRVDHLSLFLYWNLLTRAFRETKEEEAKNQIALEGDLLQYRWRDAFMVQFLYSADRPAKIGYAPAEVAALRAAVVQRFLPATAPDVDVGGGHISQDLLPLRDQQDLKPFLKCERDEGFYSSASHLFRAKAGEVVRADFEISGGPSTEAAAARPPADEAPEPRDAAPAETTAKKLGRFQVWFLGPEGRDLEFVHEENPMVPNASAYRFEFTAPTDGLYRLNARVVNKGGVRASFAGRPHVMEARPLGRKNVLRLEKLSNGATEGAGHAVATTRWYFYVPKGTRAFAIEAACSGRSKPLLAAFETADGRAVMTEAVPAGGELLARVPAGKDGAVWKVELDSDRSSFGISGAPPFVAGHPDQLLVPREP